MKILQATLCFDCRTAPILLLLLLLPWGSAVAFCQAQDAPQLPTPPGQAGGRDTFGKPDDSNQDPTMRHIREEAEKKRNIDRQNRLVADTNRLLQLAQELKAEVDKSNKDTLSLTVVKKAEEMEKLAKNVKERMKTE